MKNNISYSMNWNEEYKRKLLSAADAAALIKSNDHIFSAGFGGDPETLLTAIASRKNELSNVIISSCNSILRFEHSKPEYEGHFIDNQWFLGPGARSAIQAGRGTYTTCNFGQFEMNLKNMNIDYAVMVVSPPDKHGFMSFGIMVAFCDTIARTAKKVIVQVNENMPRVLGNTFIHVSQVDHIVEANDKMLTIPSIPTNPISEAIASYIAAEVDDGATLQLGVGAIPNAVGRMLAGKHNLGIHSEMITEAMLDLLESGALTGEMKTLHRGKIVGTFAGGSERLYRWMDNNPMIEAYPVGYTNDPYIILKNAKQISVNATLEVDLTGQACSESIGSRQYSGVGGQADYVRGAVLSPGGKSFLVLNSTVEVNGGIISSIVPTLKVGSAVTTSRNDIDHVVTEYGIAALRGKSVRQRAFDLISISHPDFRSQLREEAKKLCLV